MKFPPTTKEIDIKLLTYDHTPRMNGCQVLQKSDHYLPIKKTQRFRIAKRRVGY